MKRILRAVRALEDSLIGDAIGVFSLAVLLIGGLILGAGMGWK